MLLPKRDPGPCPVDDAPHTTCTSADYDPKTERTHAVIVEARPPRDGPRQPRSAPRIVARTPSESAFTTATYTHEKHHHPRKRRAAAT